MSSYAEYLTELLGHEDELPEAWAKQGEERQKPIDLLKGPKKSTPPEPVTVEEERLEQQLLDLMAKHGRRQEMHVDRLRQRFQFFKDAAA
jgi:hypothetical protein